MTINNLLNDLHESEEVIPQGQSQQIALPFQNCNFFQLIGKNSRHKKTCDIIHPSSRG
jgi:hypothetical protein